jgi:iron-sulfur cluster assembly protein
MALDEPKVNDEVIKYKEITYLIEKELFNQVKPIKIDFVDSMMGSGFSITSSMEKPEKGDSCGSCSCS